jgi:hypothetical protein
MRSAPLRFAPLRIALARTASMRIAPLRSALVRCALLRSAPLRFAPLRFASARCASLRIAPLRSASLRFAPLRFAPLRSALLRFALLRFVPMRFVPMRFAPPRFAQGWRSAPLRSAPLRFALMRSAKLRSALLSFALLRSGAIEGSFLLQAFQTSTPCRRSSRCSGLAIRWRPLCDLPAAETTTRRSSATVILPCAIPRESHQPHATSAARSNPSRRKAPPQFHQDKHCRASDHARKLADTLVDFIRLVRFLPSFKPLLRLLPARTSIAPRSAAACATFPSGVGCPAQAGADRRGALLSFTPNVRVGSHFGVRIQFEQNQCLMPSHFS